MVRPPRVARPALRLLGALLGDRLTVAWWNAPILVQWGRQAWATGFLVLAGIALVLAPLIYIEPSQEMNRRVAGVLAVAGVCLVVVALIPDTVAGLANRLRHRR